MPGIVVIENDPHGHPTMSDIENVEMEIKTDHHCHLGAILNIDKAVEKAAGSIGSMYCVAYLLKKQFVEISEKEAEFAKLDCDNPGECAYHDRYDVDMWYILELEQLLHQLKQIVDLEDEA